MTIKLEFIQVGLNLNVRRILWPNSQLLYFGIIVTFLSYHASDLHLIRKKTLLQFKEIFLIRDEIDFFLFVYYLHFFVSCYYALLRDVDVKTNKHLL